MAIAKASSSRSGAGPVRYCSDCAAVYRSDFQRCPNDGGCLVVSDVDPLLGETLGDSYVIEALIGEGAMGRVYRARHRSLANHRYAIKVLIGDLAVSSTMRQRFQREAQNASKLDHPNVVNVIDFGRAEMGLHYLVMDLVEGQTLASIAAQGPMDSQRVIRIAHQLCEGLEHAHGRGVIHRDFKPDNILIVGEPGREIARIADFGLAMSTRPEVRLTISGVACTPAYAAPEQLRGGAIDHRVDLYGLGATLFEMLSGGYLPFEGDIDTTIRSKLSLEAPSILTRAPNVPPGLVTIVSRLLAHDRDQRPRSARAVIRALETSMTLPRPKIRTIDMVPLRKEHPGRRARLLKGTALGAAILAMALVAQRASESEDVPHVSVTVEELAPPAEPTLIEPPVQEPIEMEPMFVEKTAPARKPKPAKQARRAHRPKPAPSEPAPSEPAPSEPAPSEPTSVPSEPSPVPSEPARPASAEPAEPTAIEATIEATPAAYVPPAEPQ